MARGKMVEYDYYDFTKLLRRRTKRPVSGLLRSNRLKRLEGGVNEG